MSEPRGERVYNGFYQIDVVQTPNGKREIIHALNAVAVLLYIPARDKIVLISQIRLPMKNEENPEGRIIEVPAGRFDKDLDAKDLIIQEVLEETGITLKRRQIRLLNSGVPLAASPGSLTQRDYLAYAEVEERQIEQEERIFGAEDEGEEITRLFVPVSKLESMVFDDKTAWALVQWFLKERAYKKGL